MTIGEGKNLTESARLGQRVSQRTHENTPFVKRRVSLSRVRLAWVKLLVDLEWSLFD